MILNYCTIELSDCTFQRIFMNLASVLKRRKESLFFEKAIKISHIFKVKIKRDLFAVHFSSIKEALRFEYKTFLNELCRRFALLLLAKCVQMIGTNA